MKQLKKQVNIHEAKTRLSELLSEVQKGKDITIAKAGVPIAKLVPFALKPHKRILGLDKGAFEVSDDFDVPLEEVEHLFYGGNP
jgi:prevent-host-death family protein